MRRADRTRPGAYRDTLYRRRSCMILSNGPSGKTAMIHDENESIRRRLRELRIEHRDLDEVIARLSRDPEMDQLQIRRLKKRKLLLKDTIARLESRLIPDLDA
jgi:hypothetical protein